MAVAISEKKLSLHEFIGLVEQYPDRKFKLNAAGDAAGDAVEMSPSRSHGAFCRAVGFVGCARRPGSGRAG